MTLRFTTLATAALLALTLAANAGNTREEIQQRMKDRKDAVEKLLAANTVGENNTGYLEKLKDISADETKTVAAENADRKTVYTNIAKKRGTPADQVGKQRAKKIAENAPAGTMLQQDDGAWKKKE